MKAEKRTALSPVRSDEGYDAVIVVIFNEELEVETTLRILCDVVNELFARSSHVNGCVISLGRRLLDGPRVEQVPLCDALLDA